MTLDTFDINACFAISLHANEVFVSFLNESSSVEERDLLAVHFDSKIFIIFIIKFCVFRDSSS